MMPGVSAVSSGQHKGDGENSPLTHPLHLLQRVSSGETLSTPLGSLRPEAEGARECAHRNEQRPSERQPDDAYSAYPMHRIRLESMPDMHCQVTKIPKTSSRACLQATFSSNTYDWTRLRARWDATKTETASRRLALTCLAELCGSWLYSFAFHSSMYSILWSWIGVAGIPPPNAPVAGIFLFLSAFLSLWFSLIIFGPVGGGGHFAPQVTVAVTLLRVFPLWKAPLLLVAQSLGYLLGQFCAIMGQWDLFKVLKAQALSISGNNREVFFTGRTAFAGRTIADFVVYRRLPSRSPCALIFNEVLV